MISEDQFVEEFVKVIDFVYPKVGQLLHHCHLQVLHHQSERPYQHIPYLGIYGSSRMMLALEEKKDLLREIATYMGLDQVVCLNATQLLREPRLQLQQVDPRLWLELIWVVSQG